MMNLIRRLISRPGRYPSLQESILSEALRGYEINRSEFPGNLLMPAPFGNGLPERAVELMFARLLYQPGKAILDLGHANAMMCHRRLVETLPGPRNLTGIDIADPVYDTRPFYTRSIRADISNNSFKDGEFDLIWCISTLEHFGMDNSVYTNTFTRDLDMASKALKEMMRILKTGGQLLITVPYGRFENHSSHINYDAPHWQCLLDPVRGQSHIREWFFRHTFRSGWQLVPAEELRYTGYFDQANAGAGGLAVALVEKKSTSP